MKLLRIQHASEMTTLSPSQIKRMERAGTFPQSIRLGPKAKAWIEEEIETWVEERKEKSSRA